MIKSDAKDITVNLVRVVKLIYEHLTEALCEHVFAEIRDKERQRKWTFSALVQFWTEVILRAPKTLTEVLQTCAVGGLGWPWVGASEQAFFEKSAALPPRFFATLFERFLVLILPRARRNFGGDLGAVRDKFPEVWAIDGSRLSAVWKRLKVLCNVKQVLLPGCLTVIYDMVRGVPRGVDFYADAAKGEMDRAFKALRLLVPGTLLVGDRLYAVPRFTTKVSEAGAFVLARYNQAVKLKKRKKLSRRHYQGGGILTEWQVGVGGTGTTPADTWRYISWQKGRTHHQLITTVLDRKLLSAEEALAAYPVRWTIERMFFDLKEVLNLNRIYCANPNAVAQQVYAAALVYTAMRIAQSEIASEIKRFPEAISTAKLFPRMAAAAVNYTIRCDTFQAVRKANPTSKLIEPDWENKNDARVKLSSILVEKRNGKRKKKRYHKDRSKWKSFNHFPATRKLIEGN